MLQDLSSLCRHQCPFRWLVLRLELIHHLLERHPFDTFMLVYMFNESVLAVSETVRPRVSVVRTDHTSHASGEHVVAR
jgi:hypothetical protein